MKLIVSLLHCVWKTFKQYVLNLFDFKFFNRMLGSIRLALLALLQPSLEGIRYSITKPCAKELLLLSNHGLSFAFAINFFVFRHKLGFKSLST